MLFTDASLSGHIALSEVVDLAEVKASRRRRDRRLRTFWRHGHLSMKMEIATAMHHSAV